MGYIKWLILDECREFFDSGVFIPVMFLNIMIVGLIGGLSMTVGIVLAVISIGGWAFSAFCFAQEAFRKNYAEYLKSRNK